MTREEHYQLVVVMILVAVVIFMVGLRAIQVPHVEDRPPPPVEQPAPLPPDTPGLLLI